MAITLTRGELTPAKITNLSTNDEVKFMFNPKEYSLTKTNSWTGEKRMGQNIPEQVFESGGAQSVTLDLTFDSLMDGDDVRQYTEGLWKMMMVDTSAENAESGKSVPPAVAFEWGRLYLKAVVTSITETITLFDGNGVPLRCTVKIGLTQIEDDTAHAPQAGTQTSGYPAAVETTMTAGDRIDNVAAATGFADDMRAILEANNIDNPLNIPVGTAMAAGGAAAAIAAALI